MPVLSGAATLTQVNTDLEALLRWLLCRIDGLCRGRRGADALQTSPGTGFQPPTAFPFRKLGNLILAMRQVYRHGAAANVAFGDIIGVAEWV